MLVDSGFYLKMALTVSLALVSFSVLHRNVFHYIHYFTICRFIVTFFGGGEFYCMFYSSKSYVSLLGLTKHYLVIVLQV